MLLRDTPLRYLSPLQESSIAVKISTRPIIPCWLYKSVAFKGRTRAVEMPSKNMSLPRVPKGRSKGLDPPDMDIFPIRTTSTKDYRRTTIRQATGAQAEPARRPQVGGQFQQASYTPPPQEEVLTGIWPRLKQKASVGTFSTSSSTRATPSLPSEPQIELLGLGIAGLLPGTTPQANSIKGTIFKMFGRNANSDVPVGSSRSPSRQSERVCYWNVFPCGTAC